MNVGTISIYTQYLPDVSKMPGVFEKSIKTKRAAIEIDRLLQYAWDNSKFSSRQILKLVISFNNRWRCTLKKTELP